MSARQRAMWGAGAWVIFVVLAGQLTANPAYTLLQPQWAGFLLVFAALVIVPLALELAAEANEAGRAGLFAAWTRVLQFPAALMLAWSVARAPGETTALIATPWLFVCGMVATTGWFRVRQGGWRRPFDKICGDIACMFLGIGGAWVFADRAGYRPLNFDPAIVTLTAVHFHFAGLLLPLIAGLVVRALPDSRLATRAAVGTILGVPAVAVGITTTQLGWGPAFEAAAACGLALAGMVVAILHVRLATEPVGSGRKRALLGVAGVSLFFGMSLAALYAARSMWAPVPWLDLPWMRALHGTANALGFGLGGVMAWRLK